MWYSENISIWVVSKIKDRRDKCYLNNTKCREFLYEDLKDHINVPDGLLTKDCIYDEQLFRNTIRKFQLDNNLQCDGALGRKTLAAEYIVKNNISKTNSVRTAISKISNVLNIKERTAYGYTWITI